MWRKILLVNWYFIVSVLVLLAIVISILRGYPSLYQKYLPSIQENISSIIGKPVRAEAIRIDWKGITPHITVNNLFIYSDDTKTDQLLYVKKALVSVDLYASLIHKKPIIYQLTLMGSNLEAVRTPDQRIILNGIDVSERIANRKKQKTKSKIKINLLDSSIAIQDKIKNLDYFFDKVDIELGFNKDRFKVISRFSLPKTLGESLVLIAEVDDIDKGLDKIKGDLYSKGKSINLELLSDFFPQLQTGISTGTSDFEVWGKVSSQSNKLFEGKLAFNGLRYHELNEVSPYINVENEITDFETEFQLKGNGDNWNLALLNSEIQAGGNKWNGEKYELSCTDCSEDDFFVLAAFDYFDITHLTSTMSHFPKVSTYLETMLPKIDIAGKFSNTRLLAQWQNKQLAKYSYTSSLQDSAIVLPEQEFEISSLSGELSGNHINGSMDINAPAVKFYSDKVSEHKFVDHNLTGLFKWKLIDNSVVTLLENINLSTESFSANVQGSAQLIEGILYLDLQAEIPYAQLEDIKTLLPYKKFRPKLTNWLKVAIRDGSIREGKLLLQGNLKNFPFKGKPGTFEVSANIDNGILDYRKDWPVASEITADFTIKDEKLEVNAYSGTILNSSVEYVEAKIDDIKLPRLVLNGKANGPAGDILNYLQQSSLIKQHSQIPKHINASGNTVLDLNLILTLSKKLEKERIVNGEIEFDNTNLTVTSLSLPFTGLNGKLKFDRNGADGKGLSAKLFGSPFTAEAQRAENGRTLLTVVGDFDFDTYFSANYKDMSEYFGGSAPVTARVNLPRFGKSEGDKSLDINIDSTLVGLSSSLPRPFNKEVDELKDLRINAKYQKNYAHPIYIDYDNNAFLYAKFSEEDKKLSAVELRLGDNQFKPPEQGVKISGKFDRISLQEWKKTFTAENKSNNTIGIDEIDIQANVLSLPSIEFKDVNLRLNKDDKFWLGNIQSSVARGEFQYPLAPNSSETATGNFEYLRFNKPEKDSNVVIDPRIIPALHVQAKLFEYDKYKFTDVELNTSVSPSGMLIKSLTGKGDDLQVTVNGNWEVGANDAQSTSVDIALDTENLHNSLIGLGFETGVSKGEGSITAKLNWPNAPYKFSVDSFLGTANLRIKDGEIESVKPGAGRIIGLVNLSEITRRLSLDFKDFFAKGYVFDKIRGDLNFKNANLTTENLSIEGPSADILIEGRTGIIAKDYDQVVTIAPHVSGGLPWIGLAVGGPLGAVGVIVGEKVAKTIGIDVDKVTEVKYSMTGGWDHPKLEPIAHKKVVKANPKAKGQPSPQPKSPGPASEKSKIPTPSP